ncbi:hypothetical protein IV498_15625 [Paenarthrobacter sp. Z7-10]|uniref:hypothetical protein n=1 Tax=Paenarthrobacter sp. Z7-10 TaxID=2787635 RepID=UPI0022A9DFA7|nr:hypothetical protein [Paenarthrobacter sp. Z7-10]MCZ2404568.1 hypothetical protein [Paenarthrobacter sp. Z7-10]
MQKHALLDRGPSAVVAVALTGKGPTILTVPRVPAGRKRIGVSVNCDKGTAWKVTLDQRTPASSHALCDMDFIPSVDFPVDHPERNNTLKISIDSGARFWITVYYF